MLTDTASSALTILLFWGTLVVYGISSLWWVFQITVLSYGWRSENDETVGLENVQVRILTVSAEDTVRVTTSKVPESVAEVHVIAEEPIDVEDAIVHIVPDEFECRAQRKGRAIEWARQNTPCEQEYVLYLDEDSLMTNLEGLPPGDIVQLTEHPLQTGSLLAYLCEILRVGFQFEQRAFHRLEYPTYAWGGAVAIRHEVENQVTWDVSTITEDTTFIWRAADQTTLDYQLIDAKVRNQAPPTLVDMFEQRRRWVSGTMLDLDLLPRRYRAVILTRIITWALSPVIPVFAIITYLYPGLAPSSTLYLGLSVALFAIVFLFMALGLIEYRKYPEVWSLYFLATPLAVFLHSLGALWGLLRPATDFEVTEKTATVDTGEVKRLNPELSEDETESHSETDSPYDNGEN